MTMLISLDENLRPSYREHVEYQLVLELGSAYCALRSVALDLRIANLPDAGSYFVCKIDARLHSGEALSHRAWDNKPEVALSDAIARLRRDVVYHTAWRNPPLGQEQLHQQRSMSN